MPKMLTDPSAGRATPMPPRTRYDGPTDPGGSEDD